jgi:hypothetical protein
LGINILWFRYKRLWNKYDKNNTRLVVLAVWKRRFTFAMQNTATLCMKGSVPNLNWLEGQHTLSGRYPLGLL